MATKYPVVHVDNRKVLNAVWEALGNADTGNPIGISRITDKMIHITGTQGGATIAVQGSNNNVDWAAVTSDGISPIVSLGGHYLYDNYRYLRVTTTGGTGTDLDFTIVGSALI